MDRLRYILDFQWAAGLSLATARLFFLAFFLLVLVFAVLQRRDYIYAGAPDRARWRDLRLWAAALMVLQIAIYMSF